MRSRIIFVECIIFPDIRFDFIIFFECFFPIILPDRCMLRKDSRGRLATMTLTAATRYAPSGRMLYAWPLTAAICAIGRTKKQNSRLFG